MQGFPKVPLVFFSLRPISLVTFATNQWQTWNFNAIKQLTTLILRAAYVVLLLFRVCISSQVKRKQATLPYTNIPFPSFLIAGIQSSFSIVQSSRSLNQLESWPRFKASKQYRFRRLRAVKQCRCIMFSC